MLSSSPRDNWERLVAAVVKREQIRWLCHQDSITTASSSFRSDAPSHFSEEFLSVSRNSESPPRQRPFTTASGIGVKKNTSRTITWKLFSALPWRLKLKDNHLDDTPDEVRARRFSLPELQIATDNFHDRNIVGRDSHGFRYKGHLADGSLVEVKRLTDFFSDKNILEKKGGEIDKGQLEDGFLVAVKKLTPKDQVLLLEQFEISSIVSHHYVCKILGFCITKKEQLLVFPYMANGSVSSCLRARFVSQPPLNWAIRSRIAMKVARGLLHLHHDSQRPIMHRDIKAANILLDENFEAFISDFTLAKFMDCNDEYDTVMGTFGHIAPEYISTGKCSLKNDVYGYGAFLLELITGQRVCSMLANGDSVVLLDWVKKLYKEKNFEMMVDRNLEGKVAEEEVEMMSRLALICTQSDPERRPMMSEVVRMLEYGDGLVVYENYLANQLHPSSMQVIDYSSFYFDADEQPEPGDRQVVVIIVMKSTCFKF